MLYMYLFLDLNIYEYGEREFSMLFNKKGGNIKMSIHFLPKRCLSSSQLLHIEKYLSVGISK